MKSYYYLDYLHREIFLEEEDIQTVPESGRADDACSAIAEKPYVVEQFMADSFRTLKDVQPPVRFPLILKAATMR
ncbi:hypothetical protein NXX23_17665 [Bacteroides ovatus]|nr:hypothetical protein [Bacteroides ovatus]